MNPLFPPLLALGLCLALSACSAPPRPDQPMSTGTLSAHLSRLVPAGPAQEDSLAQARRVQYVIDRLREAGAQPVRRHSFLLPHSSGPVMDDLTVSHVMGYVSGRHPRHASRLVLVTADLDSPAAAALLEATRLLLMESRFAVVPEATVGVVFWNASRSGLDGVSDFLRNPPWALEAVERAFLVQMSGEGEDPAPYHDAWAAAGIPFEIISVSNPPGAAEASRPEAVRLGVSFRLAEAALERLRSASTLSSGAHVRRALELEPR